MQGRAQFFAPTGFRLVSACTAGNRADTPQAAGIKSRRLHLLAPFGMFTPSDKTNGVKTGRLVERRATAFAATPPRFMNCLTKERLRDYIIRAHGMATANYVQTDSEMRRRIGAMLGEAIERDGVMLEFLKGSGPQGDREEA